VHVHRPETLDELRAIVATAAEIRVLGTRHSFNEMAQAADVVSLAGLGGELHVDRAAGTATVGAATTYAELAAALAPHGLALANLASLPHISVGGAIATATHGSGDANGNLATAVAGLELVTSSGDLLTTARGDPDFDGLVVGLGALGAVTRVTLDVEPAYEMRQRVYEGLAWDALEEHFGEITASGDSVSVFSTLGDATEQVWVKRRVTGEPEHAPPDLFGAPAATVEHHPILGLDPVHATAQLGRPGPWWDRLPHFRAGFVPSVGEELQAEYLVPREQAIPAIRTVRALADRIRPLLAVSEIRTVTADRLWLSPQYGRAAVGIHFTLRPDRRAVERMLRDVEPALAEHDARPHWGKLFLAGAEAIAPRYERLADFAELAARLDPRSAFRNDWLRAHVLGDAR
jgi:xylitol oxidase